MKSLTGPKKGIQFFPKVQFSANFDYWGQASKWIFATYKQNLEKKPLGCFLGTVVANILSKIELSNFLGKQRRQLAVLQIDIIKKCWIPLVAIQQCFILQTTDSIAAM